MRQTRVLSLVAGTVISVVSCGRDGSGKAPELAKPLEAREGSIVTDDGVRLYYRVVGSGEETVIVPLALFHGTELDGLGRTRRLVLYDPRGRGRSDTVPASKTSLGHNLSDLDEIRAAVGADRVALIGWSGLGMELFVYALRNPTRVTRLVQLAPVAPRWEPYSALMMADRARRTDTAARYALRARIAQGEFQNDQAKLCRAMETVNRPATFGDTSAMRRAPDPCGNPTEWPDRIGAYFGAFMGSIEGFNWRDSLSQVSGVPRLVIHGERDNTPVEGNREWVAGQANARLLVIPGAGHWPHYERPEQTLLAIEQFLRGEWPAGSEAVP